MISLSPSSATSHFAGGLLFSVALLAISSLQTKAQVALSLSGVNEASVITLPASVLSTNLSVTGAVTGAAGPQSVFFALEVQGAVVQRKTSAPPYVVSFPGIAPGKYFLSAGVEGAPSAVADVSFDVAAASLRPANDSWSQATTVAAIGTGVFGTNTFASREAGEPSHADNAGGRSLWWKWTAPSNGTYTVTTLGSGFDTVLGVYRGTNVSALVHAAANDDAGPGTNVFSQATFTGALGSNYYFAVDSALAPDGTMGAGTVQLKVLATPPPSVVITAPFNGLTLLVPLATSPTNTTASAAITDGSGLSRVEYALDGGPGAPRSGTWSAPYQLPLTGLLEGDYLLTVTAVGTSGLITSVHAGFSVASVAPHILLGDATEPATNGFKFALTGRKGLSYALESSTNLTAWSGVASWTNFDGVRVITDTNSPQFKTRFYRAGTPQ